MTVENNHNPHLPLEPRPEDHTLLHYSGSIFHPTLPQFWSERYAGQIIQYLQNQPDYHPQGSQQAISRAILDDWHQHYDPQVLSDLHLTEAEARHTTPWVLQQILHIQQNLYQQGIVSLDNPVRSRDDLMARLGPISPADDLADIGARVSGFALCASTIILLSKISPTQAQELQGLVTREAGASYYRSQVRFSMGQRQSNHLLIASSTEGMQRASTQAGQICSEYLNNLPSEVRRRYLSLVFKSNLRAVRQLIHHRWDSAINRIRPKKD